MQRSLAFFLLLSTLVLVPPADAQFRTSTPVRKLPNPDLQEQIFSNEPEAYRF